MTKENQIQKNKVLNIGIFLFFLLLFITGMLVTKDYGIHCDQDSELDILYSNVKEYNVRILGSNEKLEALFANYEEIEGREVPVISESIERDHGVAPYYLIVPFLFMQQENPIAVVQIQHYYNFLLYFICILSLYYLAKKITSSKLMGVLAATCLYLTPRFFAEAHYNNKDILLFAMFVITMAAGYRFLETKKFLHLFLFSMIAACTANIKIIGVLPFGILLFVYLLERIKKKEIHKKEIMYFCASILLFLVFLMILTPAIWDGPIAYFSYLIDNAAHFNRWDNRILFQGNVYRQSVTGLPRKYVLVEYAITTPIGILVCSAMGAALLLWDFLKHPKKILGDPKNCIPFILVTMQVAFLGYAVLSNMIIYNGWRHLYFTYVGTMMAIIYLGKKAVESKYIKFKKVGIGFVLLFLLGLCISGIKNHPFQYTYFNKLAGNDVTENYEIDYWCVSTYNALLELQETEETEITITSLETVTWDRLREAILLVPEGGPDIGLEKKEAGWINTDYILDNPMYSKMYYEKEYAYIREEYELVVVIHAYGNEVLSIYKKRK